MEKLGSTAYLAPREFESQLRRELTGITAEHGRLLVASGEPQDAHWAQNIWLDPVLLRIRSVSDAARQLRAIQRNWVHYSFHLHRRGELIQAALPHVSARPMVFPTPAPQAQLGSWTLLEASTILASARCTSPFPHGEAAFVEDKIQPPNRAYLKLWEALTLLGKRPGPGDRVLDAGASPGGWTWVLAQLGSNVVAIDRAPLDPGIASLPGVESRLGSALALTPNNETFDWVFSDVVCYPERLLDWTKGWLEEKRVRGLVLTLKFQGDAHYEVIQEFARIPGSRLLHLHHNKHELTWMLYRESALTPADAPATSSSTVAMSRSATATASSGE